MQKTQNMFLAILTSVALFGCHRADSEEERITSTLFADLAEVSQSPESRIKTEVIRHDDTPSNIYVSIRVFDGSNNEIFSYARGGFAPRHKNSNVLLAEQVRTRHYFLVFENRNLVEVLYSGLNSEIIECGASGETYSLCDRLTYHWNQFALDFRLTRRSRGKTS